MKSQIMTSSLCGVVSFLALLCSMSADEICTKMGTNGDNKFYHTPSNYLFENPDSYMNEPVPSTCNLHYVDPLMIGPGEGKKNTWITFLGDSLNRHLFYELAPRFSNYEPAEDEDLSDSMEHVFPLLGPHEGPKSDKQLGGKLATFHNHKLLCCKNIEGRSSAIDKNSNCLYALEDREDGNGNAAFDKHGAKTYGHYLFKDIGYFVDTVVAPKYSEDGFTCISMIWAPTFGSATDQLGVIYDGKHKHTPDAIIMNMGIHMFDVSDHDTDKFVNYTNTLYEKYQPTILYHSPASVDESNPDYSSSATPRDMKHLISVVESRMNGHKWPAISKYLDFYDWTQKLHVSGCSEDGIHFLSKESVHNSLIAQWDLNWLEKLGTIRVFRRTLKYYKN